MIRLKRFHWALAAAGLAVVVAAPVVAQTGPSTLSRGAPAASATPPVGVVPTPTRPGPQLLTPEQKRDAADGGSDLTPERQVTNQLSIPFGKAPPPSTAEARAARRNLPVSASGGINDAVASCEAQANTAARTACLQRQGKR